ncbi:MAG: metallophosphoesterase family protein [Candidatus Helarchaeota archaeon]
MRSFKIYAISDLHANRNKFRFAAGVIKEEMPDMLIICGDISHSSRADRLRHMISLLEFRPIYFILGNMDGQKVSTQITNAINLHLKCKVIKGYHFCGIGGPSDTLDQFIGIFKDKIRDIDTKKLIIISHIPPKGHCDKVYRGARVGSEKLRKLISELQPRLLLCGHIHEDRGISRLGDTIIVNVGHAGCIVEIDEDDNITYRLI